MFNHQYNQFDYHSFHNNITTHFTFSQCKSCMCKIKALYLNMYLSTVCSVIFEIFRANLCILMLHRTLHFSWCSSIWMSVSLDLRSSFAACRAEISASGFSPFVRPFLAIESNPREALLMHSLRLHRNFPRRSQDFPVPPLPHSPIR